VLVLGLSKKRQPTRRKEMCIASSIAF